MNHIVKHILESLRPVDAKCPKDEEVEPLTRLTFPSRQAAAGSQYHNIRTSPTAITASQTSTGTCTPSLQTPHHSGCQGGQDTPASCKSKLTLSSGSRLRVSARARVELPLVYDAGGGISGGILWPGWPRWHSAVQPLPQDSHSRDELLS